MHFYFTQYRIKKTKPTFRQASLIPFMLLAFSAFLSPSAFSQQTNDNALAIVNETNEAIANSQQHINQLSQATAKMLQEYREIVQRKDYQQYYNFQLKQQKQAQEQEIALLQNQLQELDYIEVAIMPLMQSMLAALEEFIALDMPFHHQTRLSGVQTLRHRIHSGSLSLPDKYRLLMEGWQIEHNYGNSIETWRDKLSASTGQASDSDLAVNYLRIGRAAFYYLTLDESHAAIWDKTSRTWVNLPSPFIPDLLRSIHVASEQIAPELMPLPLRTKEWQ